MGHDVVVVTSDIPKGASKSDGIRTYRFKAIDIPYVPYVFNLKKKINLIDGDIFHSHSPSPFFSKAIDKRPHVITYHSDLEVPPSVGRLKIPRPLRGMIDHLYEKMYARPILDSCDAIIATSKSYADSSPILCDYQYEVIPNAINIKKFDAVLFENLRFSSLRTKVVANRRFAYPKNRRFLRNSQSPHPERKPKVLFVGRLFQGKGIEYLIRTAPRVIKEVPQARYTIVGDGEERDRLERLTKKLNVHEYVKFTGFIRFEELVKMYAESSVLVLPSITRLENFGIVLLEAMACRTPVIASKIPGVMDLVTTENGLLVEPKSVEGLAEAIISIIHDENKVIKMGEKGRRLVDEEYNWDVVGTKIIDLYRKLI